MIVDFKVILHTILGNQRRTDGSVHKVPLSGSVYFNTHGLEAEERHPGTFSGSRLRAHALCPGTLRFLA